MVIATSKKQEKTPSYFETSNQQLTCVYTCLFSTNFQLHTDKPSCSLCSCWPNLSPNQCVTPTSLTLHRRRDWNPKLPWRAKGSVFLSTDHSGLEDQPTDPNISFPNSLLHILSPSFSYIFMIHVPRLKMQIMIWNLFTSSLMDLHTQFTKPSVSHLRPIQNFSLSHVSPSRFNRAWKIFIFCK